MKQKTPLKLLEEWLDNHPDYNFSYQTLLAKIQELKPVERDIIIEAHKDGFKNLCNGHYYFNENYEQ